MPRTIRYTDVANEARTTCLPDNPAFTQSIIEDKYWGKVVDKIFTTGHFTFIEHKADLRDTFTVQYDDQILPHSVNMCMSLKGHAKLNLKNSGFTAGITTNTYHAVYSDETEYDISISNQVHIIRLIIDLPYYTNLLCEKNRWTGAMREKLQRRQLAFSGSGNVEPEMRQVVQTINNNALSGNLKNLLIEAKILELLALQIGQLSGQGQHQKFKPADVDTFHDLRLYLSHRFADDLSLKQLSRTFGINEFKLKKGFKELFKSTVFDYIHDCRMNHARHLLLEEKKFVNEVSGKVGYKNANHFSTAFKKRFGVSPGTLK